MLGLKGSSLLQVLLRTIAVGLNSMVVWVNSKAERKVSDFPQLIEDLDYEKPADIDSFEKLWEGFGPSYDQEWQVQDPNGDRIYINHCYAEYFRLLCRIVPELPMLLENYVANTRKLMFGEGLAKKS